MRKKSFLMKATSVAASVVMALSLAACGASGSSGKSSKDSDTIKIGIIDDQTGNNATIGLQKIAGYKLAAKEINAAGGINGKQIDLEISDGQGDNTVYQQVARKMVQEGDIDVVMGGLTSASREAIRPIMDSAKMLYFYNEQYEGGVADHYTFCTDESPEQQMVPVFADLMNQYGKKIYIIAADYNFGQISTNWMERIVKENGGEVVGSELIPLDVSQFSSTISNIKAANPDILVSFLVGSNHTSFYEQWNNAGMSGMPMFTTTSCILTYEHKLFPAPTMENTYVLSSFTEELDTDAAKKFVEAYREDNSEDDIPYIGIEAEAAYSAIYLYKAAVEKAGTTDTEKVISALESGEISFDGPGGTVTVDGASHHCIRDITEFRCDENENLVPVQTFKAVKPTYLTEDCGVDLRKSNPNKQFTPLDEN